MAKNTDSEQKIKKLAKKIVKASHDYYNGTPSVSDKVWDAWFDELKQLAPDHPVVTGVGAIPVSEWQKVQHEVPMASLNKVNIPDEFLTEWVARDCQNENEFLGTEKLDGISVSVKYENGKFVYALTRGDSNTGEDISQNVQRMKGVLDTLHEPFSGHIRGEIVLLKSDHKAHFPEYANPRNAASGIARRYDGDGSEHLTVLFYNIDGDFDTEEQAFQKLEQLGLKTPTYKVLDAAGCVSLWKSYQDSIRASLDYEIDGLVFTVNNCSKQYALGEKGRGPAGSVAFKFEAPSAITTILDIIWQVGSTGRMTPVAVFEPVDLLGAEVKRASLYNQSYIEEIGVGIGAQVIIQRANDVIPRVEEVVEPSTNGVAKLPGQCPECSTQTIRTGEYLLCPNKASCPPQILGKVSTWIKELGALEWGDKILQKLIDSGLVNDIPDIYKLSVDDIANLDRMGKRSAQNLIKELDKFREIPLYNLIGGLGINNVATSTVKLVMAAGHNTLESIQKLSAADLEWIPGFGSIKAKSFHDGLVENKERIQAILNAGVKIKEQTQGTLSGFSFCFTGASSLPRKELHQIVENCGGEVKKSVVKGLSYLVVADPNSTSSKTKAAKKNGTKIISEDEFVIMAEI